MKLALSIWFFVGFFLYVIGAYIGGKKSKDDVLAGIYAMPGGFMLIVAVIWGAIVFFNWLWGLWITLAIIYGLYLLIRTDSQAVHDKKVLITFLSIFTIGALVFFLL